MNCHLGANNWLIGKRGQTPISIEKNTLLANTLDRTTRNKFGNIFILKKAFFFALNKMLFPVQMCWTCPHASIRTYKNYVCLEVLMKTKISFSLLLFLSLLFFCAPNVFSQCIGIKCGDCNIDGDITVLDALETARISVGLLVPYPDQNIACDTDRSGDISVIDALTVAKAAVGDKTVSLRCFPFTTIDNIGPGVILHRELIGMDYDVLNPDFSCPDTTDFFEIIPDRGTTQLTITLAGMSYPTNMNLYTGKPGTMPGDIDSHHYLQRIRMDSTPETYQLSCSGLDMRVGRVAVAVHSASPGFYSLNVSGSDVPCTCNPSGGIIAAGARALGRIRGQRGPDIPNPCDTTNSQTYELTTIPPGTTSIRFLMAGPPPRDDGDYDLWLGYPRTCGGDCYATNYHGTALATPEGWGNPMFIEEYEMTGPELASYGAGPIAMGVSVFTGPPGGGNLTLDVFTRGSGGPASASQQGTSPVSGSVSTCRLDSWV